MQGVILILMGFSSILMQVTALRQLLSVFSGNELDIGITLSVWLVFVGIGSYAGSRMRLAHAFPLSFLALALIVQPSIQFINLIRPLFSFTFGEIIPITTTIFATVISLLPICLVIGAQFPLAVSYANGKTAKVYGLEALGAFMGGVLFTLFLSGNVGASFLSAATGVMNILAAIVLFRKKILITLLAVPFVFSVGANRISASLHEKGAEFVERRESRYGEITVLKMRGQYSVYVSGKFDFAYPDPQTEEMKAHLPMSLHPSPDSVLIIGGSPAVLREVLKYPAARMDFVEIDPELLHTSFTLLDKIDHDTLHDERIAVFTTDARRFIKTQQGSRYDLVVLNLPEPATANINRFYTIEFFKEVKMALKQGGMLYLALPTSYGYVGKRMQAANGSVYNSLKSVFKSAQLSSEEYGVMIASDGFIDTDPMTLEGRFYKNKVITKNFHPYIFKDAFSPLKVSMIRARLEKAGDLNTDMRPAANIYNLMVWAEMQAGAFLMAMPDYGGRLIFIALAAAACAAILLRQKRQGVYYSMFITGFSAMSFSLIIILAYQAAFGYVYEMIGLITAMFMAGIAIGAYGIRVSARPLRRIRMLNAAVIALLGASFLLLRHEALYYLLNLIIGVAAGGEFGAANQFLREGEPIRAAGKLYALDLAGSFFGALLTAIILVPLFGIQKTILFVAVLKAISLVLLFSIKYEKA